MKRKRAIAILLAFVLSMIACTSINGISTRAQSSIPMEDPLDYEENILSDEENDGGYEGAKEGTDEILQDIEVEQKNEYETESVAETEISEDANDESLEETEEPTRILNDTSDETVSETEKPNDSSDSEEVQVEGQTEATQIEAAEETMDALEMQDAAETVADDMRTDSAGHIHMMDNDNLTFVTWTDLEAASQYENNAMTSYDSLPNQEGNFVLEKDVNLAETWKVPTGTTNLCLNGHSIIMDNDGDAILVGENAALILSDCENNQGVVTHANGKSGSGVEVASGTFIMNGGAIVGNSSESGGSGVFIIEGSFVLNDGSIRDNSSGNGVGAGVYVKNGNFVMNGGTISNNTAQNGGGVFADSGCTFTMIGGNINGNNAYKGSGVYAYNSSLTLTGGRIIGNISNGGDGGVFVNGGGTLSASFGHSQYQRQPEK